MFSEHNATDQSSDGRPPKGTRHRQIRLLFGLAAAWSLLVLPSAWADGGLVRLSEKAGNYRITVFTSPTPFRAGPVEIGVLVQEAESERALPDAEVTVEVALRNEPGSRLRGKAEKDKLIPSVNFDLAKGGWWQIRVAVAGRLGQAETSLELEADDPLPPWRALSFWIFLPVIPVVLYIVHQWLARLRLRRNESCANESVNRKRGINN